MKRWLNVKRLLAGCVVPAFLLCLWGAGYVIVPGCFFNLHRAESTAAVDRQTGALTPDPALITGTLDNGFRYAVMKNDRPARRVHMHLVVEAGSIHETDDQQGLAHYLEHMLFNGTSHFPPGELVKYFQSIGMGFGNDVNAHTGFFRTVYDLHLPSGDRKELRDGLLVMADYAEGALILESEVDKERGVILSEKRSRDSAPYRTYKAALNFELPGSRIIQRYPIGIEEVIQATGRDRLKSFYDTWYRPERMTLVMAGDFDPATAITEITEIFSGIQARGPERSDPDIGLTVHEGIRAFYHHEKEAGGTEVTLETLRQVPPPPDSAEEKKNRFVRNMAYRIVNYRLDELEQSFDPPFTSAYASAGRALEYYSYAAVFAETVPEKWESSLTALENVLRAALTYGFTQSEVERVKKEALAEMDRAVMQAPTRESSNLAGQIIMSLTQDRVFQSPEQNRNLLAPVAESFTPVMLHQAFKKTWESEPRLILVTGNAEIDGAGGPEEKIFSVWQKSREASVRKPEEKGTRGFPYLPDPEGESGVLRKTTDADIGVSRIDFENGVRLNMKKTDFKANQVAAVIRFGRGESTEPEHQPALCELGAEAVNESGFGGMKKEDLRLALAGKKANAVFSVGQDRFQLSGGCASDEIILLFQLVYAFYNDFTCREEAYLLSLDRFRQRYDEKKHTISGAMALEGDRFLAGGDSRFGWPSAFSAFESLKPDDIRSWVKNALRQSLPEISVVGDFSPREVADAAARYFGTLQMHVAEKPERSSRRTPFVPEGESKILEVPTEIHKAYVEVAWPTDDFWDIRRTRRLMLLARIFTDRMRLAIREDAGQSYSQYAYNEASLAYPGYGVFHAAAEINPEEAGKVTSAIMTIAADIIEHGVTEEELERAREPVLTGIKEMVETNGYWLSSVLSGCRDHPERLEWSRTLLDDYRSMTADDMTRLARQYLGASRCATLIIRPEKSPAGHGQP